MCIIAVSRKGVRQPSLEELRTMWSSNPHGAGYMYARYGQVTIHKGFMNLEDFIAAITQEGFTAKDPVVYHFRISTQAGVNPRMTHPFPLSSRLDHMEKLDLTCPVGVAHNGIIHMTSDPTEKRFSDTALFVTQYLTKLIRRKSDLTDPAVETMIEELTNSKWAIMDGQGGITTVGRYLTEDGLLFSNSSYRNYYMGGCKR